MTVDEGIEIPANASAVVVAPSLVSDRYVQLTPAYDGGPLMADGTTIPAGAHGHPGRAGRPDASVNELATALGPNGANANGALSDVLDTAAANLAGNGEVFGETDPARCPTATDALADSRGDLFATVDNLSTFTTMLADSDAQVRAFNDRLADVTGYLAADRDELGTALSSLGTALGDVQGFIGQQQGQDQLQCGQADRASRRRWCDQRAAVAEILDVAPLAMSNFLSTYDAASGVVRDPRQPQRADLPAGADAVPHDRGGHAEAAAEDADATCASSSPRTSTGR